jgi:hypothetical protein
MAALYPVSVHTYSAHRDAVDYILADHVNSLQDEVTAIERALGAGVNHWSYSVDPLFSNLASLAGRHDWSSVKERLDSFQAHIVRLENITAPAPSGPTRVGSIPDARAVPPVTMIRNPGQMIPVSAVQWTNYDMSVAEFDSGGFFTGGNSVASPQTGWWSISATVVTDVPDGTPGTTHTVSNRVLIAGAEVATHSSMRPWGSGGQHRINLTYDGPWNLGDLLFVQSQQNPTPGSASVWSHMLLSCTYVRETV